MTLDEQLCRAAKSRVPLTPRGLRGGLQPLGGKATCLTAHLVFVHLRVAMAAKPKWTSSAQVEVAHGKPLAAEVAVRSQMQKPLVYMTITGNRASFFSARNCF